MPVWTVYVFLAFMTFLMGVVATLVSVIYSALAHKVTANATNLSDVAESQAEIKDDMRLVRVSLADHLRWSKAEHKRYDAQFRLLGEWRPDRGHSESRLPPHKGGGQ